MENPTVVPISIDAQRATLSIIAQNIDTINSSPGAQTANHAAIAPAPAPAPAATATNSDNEVRVLTLSEWKEASRSLAEAFKDDHTSLYFTHTPDRATWSEDQKWDLHVKVMEYITYAHLLKGLVVSAGPNYDCVGLWYPTPPSLSPHPN